MAKKFTKVVPLGDRILVRREEPAAMIGRIHVPETAQQKVHRGEVLAVGKGEMPAGWAGEALVGRTVTFSEYAGQRVPADVPGAELLVMLRADEVQAVLE